MELPHIEALYRELKEQGFGLITVTKDPPQPVLNMVEYNGITHPIVSDTAGVFEKYHAYDGKHYLIGSDGKILAAFSKLGISIPIVRRELAKHGIQPPVRKIASLPVRSQVPGLSIAAQKTPAPPPPVVWSAPAAAALGAAGGKLSANLVVTIAPGWYIYALSQKPGGPTPLEITMPANQPFKLGGTIVAPKPEVKFDAGFGMEVHQNRDRGEFVLPVVVGKMPAGKRTITVEARYQACNASICLPAKTERVEIPVIIK